MNITVVGAGAVGRLWGSQLSRHHKIQFWTRQPVDNIRFSFNTLDGITHPLAFVANDAMQLASSDLIIVTVKAFQVETALGQLKAKIPTSTPVVIMHNGMGTHKRVEALLPENPIIYATTAQAAYRPDEDTLAHTGIGQTWLGGLNLRAKKLSDLAGHFELALAPTQWHPDIFQPLWTKLAINCAINPLTAIHQCRNGELAQAGYQTQLATICDEVAMVMSAEGYPTSGPLLKQQVDKVILATASNFSSMNQDVCQQRATEIDYITGYLVERAKAHGIEVAENLRLWQQIKQLEQQYHDR
ncbi:2-dehydropantoate 2-reductase [Photobacterium sanctipauli]|uniref:2-dehydropantoate 2-reductase n=1 Tax=Photobacterium sanctipauli TaxID=1342794 RepID=A0A2T3NTP3_9GAMM|nr:2-dehydropantoate 2-reductase [Photobacterium sanctipauli]PSW19628.1 2-dehydropantoate 2-reductase [Photobacterium sanctipauli]